MKKVRENMAYENISVPMLGLAILEPKIFIDERGYFFESFNEKEFSKAIGQEVHFVQDNQSFSKKNVFRGLHYQEPNAQGKLIRVISGRIWDIVVDIRKTSVNYGKSFAIELSDKDQKSFWISPGFAHGFIALEDSIVSYKVTDFWVKENEKNLPVFDFIKKENMPIDVKLCLTSKKDFDFLR